MGIKDNFEETIEIRNENQSIIGSWVPYHIPMDNAEPIERWHLRIQIDKSSSVKCSDEELYEEEQKAQEVIIGKKMELMRAKYGINSFPCTDEKVAMDIIESAWEGKWVGQHDSYILRDGTVNMILAGVIDSLEINGMLRKLHSEEKIGFNGAIIVPWEEEQETYAIWEKSTKHKRIIVNDSGNWHCKFCQKFGERYTEASDYPCEVEG